jgi:hypothetical protein
VSRYLLTQHAIVCAPCKYIPCNPLFKQKSIPLPYSRIFLAVMEENGAQRGAELGWQTLSATFSLQSLHLYLYISLTLLYTPPPTLLHQNFFMSAKALMPLLFFGSGEKNPNVALYHTTLLCHVV